MLNENKVVVFRVVKEQLLNAFYGLPDLKLLDEQGELAAVYHLCSRRRFSKNPVHGSKCDCDFEKGFEHSIVKFLVLGRLRGDWIRMGAASVVYVGKCGNSENRRPPPLGEWSQVSIN